MLRFPSMAMQQSSKGVSGTGSNPALSDDQADHFAASFTPAWDSDGGAGDTTTTGTGSTVVMAPPSGESTQVMDRAELQKAQDAAPIVGTPAIIFNPKSTMIGLPPPAMLGVRPSNAPAAGAPPPAVSSAEAIDPANVLEVVSAPAPVLAAAPAPAAAVRQNPAMRTQIMDSRPSGSGPSPSSAPAVPPRAAPGATIAARPPHERTAAAVPIADPFRNKAPSSDDLDFPKRSNKTLFFVVGGLAVAAGLGLFLKFALGDDAPKAPPAEVLTGPAVTTAEIPPPPPPKEDPPPAATTAAKAAEPVLTPPPPLATPPRAPEPPPVAVAPAPQPQRAPVAAAPPHEARPRPAALPPPPAAAAPPVAAPPKSAPKGANGGIVRDNPF